MNEEELSQPTQTAQATFDDFGFSDEIMQGIREAGFQEPTPIQLKAIPPIMEGHDLIGQALTGTGKTAAFGLPVMNAIQGKKGLNFLVLVPTRELAAQVSAELFRLGRYANIHTAAFTGGQSYSRQEKLLSKGIDALVATPGRLIDLMESGHFKEINPEYIVVDEADEMLDMGFIEDVKKIFAGFTGTRHTMLFSATMPRPVVELAETILVNPVEITTADKETANNEIEQLFFVIEDRERTDAIIRLIDAENVAKAIIFCRTKEETDALNILLGGRGYNVNCLHGDMEQAQRSRVMGAFRRGEIDILVATDVAARGLDVDDVTHVFNFHLPFDSRGYVHRIGRTGRAGKTGTAITLVTPRELRQLEAIKRTVGAQIENRLIPTRSEVTSMRLKKLFHDIHDLPLDMEILNQVQTLTVNQDLIVLLSKLANKMLSGGADQGPEHIGIEGQRLTNLLTPKPRERGSRRDGRRSSSRFTEEGEAVRGRRRSSRKAALETWDNPGYAEGEAPAPLSSVEQQLEKLAQNSRREQFDAEMPQEERPTHRARREESFDKEERPGRRVRREEEERPTRRARGEAPFSREEERPGRRARREEEERPTRRARREEEERPVRRARREEEERPVRRARGEESFGKEEPPVRRSRREESFGKEERPVRRAHEQALFKGTVEEGKTHSRRQTERDAHQSRAGKFRSSKESQGGFEHPKKKNPPSGKASNGTPWYI